MISRSLLDIMKCRLLSGCDQMQTPLRSIYGFSRQRATPPKINKTHLLQRPISPPIFGQLIPKLLF